MSVIITHNHNSLVFTFIPIVFQWKREKERNTVDYREIIWQVWSCDYHFKWSDCKDI